MTVKGGVGLFAQEPTFDETDPNFGNPKLKGERAIHYSAGVEYKPRPYVTLDATGFYKDMYSMVSPNAGQFTDADGNVKPLRYDNTGKGRAYGLELVARHDFANNFTGWLAYTLSRSERLDSGQTTYRLFDFDQTHILTVLGTYSLPRNWQIGGRFRFVTGNPTTPVVDSVFNASTDQYDPVYGKLNSARIEAFHQLDIRVDKRWVYQSWMLDMYLDVQNIYNRANPEGVSYNYNFRKTAVQQACRSCPSSASGPTSEEREPCAFAFIRARWSSRCSRSSARRCWRLSRAPRRPRSWRSRAGARVTTCRSASTARRRRRSRKATRSGPGSATVRRCARVS